MELNTFLGAIPELGVWSSKWVLHVKDSYIPYRYITPTIHLRFTWLCPQLSCFRNWWHCQHEFPHSFSYNSWFLALFPWVFFFHWALNELTLLIPFGKSQCLEAGTAHTYSEILMLFSLYYFNLTSDVRHGLYATDSKVPIQ